MTKVVLETKAGVFSSLKAEGHAGSSVRGSNVVCAALSMLLRTSLDVLEHTDGIKVKSDAPERGLLSFSVTEGGAEFTPLQKARLSCVTDYLELGLSSLSKEYPGDVLLQTVKL